MALIRRITIVRCDNCSIETGIEHDICGSSNGPFNNALAEADWGEPFSKEDDGYLHLCPACYAVFKIKSSLKQEDNMAYVICLDFQRPKLYGPFTRFDEATDWAVKSGFKRFEVMCPFNPFNPVEMQGLSIGD